MYPHSLPAPRTREAQKEIGSGAPCLRLLWHECRGLPVHLPSKAMAPVTPPRATYKRVNPPSPVLESSAQDMPSSE